MDPKSEMDERSDYGVWQAFRVLDTVTAWLAFPIALLILGLYWLTDRRRQW